MILQCDQCNTRFRLDDAKLKPGGVKVRCSKCRHVFLAGAELKHEESEFDAILSGLGAPAPEKPQQAAAPSASEVGAGFGFSFDDEPGVSHAAPEPAPAAPKPAPAETPVSAEGSQPAAERPMQQGATDFTAFDFPIDSFSSPEQQASDHGAFDFAAEPPLHRKAPAASAAQQLDYGEFAFDEEPAALAEEPAPVSDQTLGFGEFSFAAEPAAPQQESAPATTGLDFSEFEFDAEPVAPPQTPPVAPEGLDFGEVSFASEPPPKIEESAAAANEPFDFADFSFAEEPAPLQEEPAAPGTETTDFGAFSFAEGPAPLQEEPAAPGNETADLGAFSFDEEPPPLQEEPAVAGKETADLGAFSFAEEPAPLQKEPETARKEAIDFGEFSFAEEPPPLEEPAPAAGVAEEFGSFSFGEDLQQKQETAAPPAEEGFGFGEFSFSQEPSGAPAASAAAEEPVAPAAPISAGLSGPTPPPPFVAPPTAKPLNGEAALDFGFAQGPVPTRVTEEPGDEEELPPLSIGSRRKGRSLLAVSIVAFSVLVIVVLSAAGFYLLQSGPAAIDQLGLGSVAKWFGMESAEEGRITIRNPQAAFYQNKEAGEIFVVTGEAVNSFRKARASIHVKVSLFDKNGAVLLQKTAYCGNRLSTEQLTTLPTAKIESIMSNPFGDSLTNLGVQPGSAIGFVVAIANVPKEAADFGVEVIGSTVAGK